METIFFKLLGMSFSASVLILILVLLRPLLKRAPKSFGGFLWALVAVRLICPFSIQSPFSLVPQSDAFQNVYDTVDSQKQIAGHVQDLAENRWVDLENSGQTYSSVTIAGKVLSYIWLCGVIALILYAICSWLHIHKQIREAIRLEDNIYEAENIPTPCIFGIFRPHIYLPFGLAEEQKKCVLAHEYAHLRRRDNWWKPLGFLLLALYWFNPLCWIAYVLFCRDIELACDELVIRKMDIQQKKLYSQALLSLSAPGSWFRACPIAFGEVGVKQRIRSVLNYKKPQFWVIAVAIAGAVFLAVCFLTDPLDTKQTSEADLPGGWGDERDWLCGSIEQISENEITIAHKYFVNEDDTARIEYFGLTGEKGEDIFLDGYEIIAAGDTLSYKISKDCEYIFVPWDSELFTANWSHPGDEENTHCATTDYATFEKYLSTYSSLEHQVFFYDIKDGEVVCIYETPLM